MCKPDTRVEILSEGAWYPGVVLDALRDGRCFVHYDGYGADDDEAVAPKLIRSAR
ncbi:agenet domain-containing protein [Paramagnetospirillum magneticum]|uniref:agenet domain-containing protein n=1 Tax=Paramagnetospirillum magneticum TaxID=84159 RepID=UPI0002EC1BB3|nr:agenet domain-containing protein [Paramagnetospirillum magneticum]